jgi:RimJ/RimL family protein N-acetyltransferase
VKRSLLFGHTDVVAGFVADRAPIERPVWPPYCHGIGILRGDGALIGGVVFATGRPEFGAWEMSCAGVSSHLLSIEIVKTLGHFAFRQLLAHRIWARTSTDNRRARAMLKALGFTEEGVNACHYGPGQHAVVARLLRPEWERKNAASTEARKAA